MKLASSESQSPRSKATVTISSKIQVNISEFSKTGIFLLHFSKLTCSEERSETLRITRPRCFFFHGGRNYYSAVRNRHF